jgi:3-hydroxyisobutyrate dehydrogenase-like beta-hydroxyacid dehydrogenase
MTHASLGPPPRPERSQRGPRRSRAELCAHRAAASLHGKRGVADSFALRNHGMKALLPQPHPENAFSVRYMLKDMTYALELARSAGLELQGAATARRLLEETVALGLGDTYHTAIVEAVKKHP